MICESEFLRTQKNKKKKKKKNGRIFLWTAKSKELQTVAF